MSYYKNNTISTRTDNITHLYKNPQFHAKLIKLLKKILKYSNINVNDTIQFLRQLNGSNTDVKFFNHIISKIVKMQPVYSEKYDFEKAERRWETIEPNKTKIVTRLLEFGGNVGNTAYALGQYNNLTKKDTLVADIPEWEGIKWEPRKDITFINAENLDEIKSNSVDMITVFHVLHHINKQDITKILKQFNRILTSDGFIVLYEHDCGNKNMAAFIDIEHALFDAITLRKPYDKFVKSYYAKYYSFKQWQFMFENSGFKKYHSIELRNLDNSFYMFFKKI